VSVNVTPATASLFNSQTQQFAATVISAGSTAVTWTIEPNVGTITANGLYTAPSSITSTQSVTVTATSVADATKSGSAIVTLNPPAPPVITQQPQNATAVAGQNAIFNVTATGLGLTYQWQIMAPGAGSFTDLAGALASSYVTPATALADSGTQFRVIVTNAQGSTPSNPAILSVLTPGSPFVTSTVLGSLRNNYPGPVGMKVTVGSKPLVVSSVGRIVAPGNTGTHTMKIIDAATGTQLASAAVAFLCSCASVPVAETQPEMCCDVTDQGAPIGTTASYRLGSGKTTSTPGSPKRSAGTTRNSSTSYPRAANASPTGPGGETWSCWTNRIARGGTAR